MKRVFAKSGAVSLAVVFVMLILPLHAVDAKEYPTLYRGPRPLAMGGAFTAVADDENALFYNPAGIAEISTLRAGIFNPLFEVSQDGMDFVNDAMDTDFDNVDDAVDFLLSPG